MPRPASTGAGQGWIKPVACLGLWAPFVWLVVKAFTDSLGPNPAEALIRSTGDWALRMICLALAVTPARVMLGWPSLARYRRMVGLTAYGYASIHLACYIWLDMGLEIEATLRDIAKRPFITVGFLTWLMLSPLAATSTNGAVKRLGAKTWRAIHRLVFPAAVLAVVHFLWMRAAKRDLAEVAVYGALVAALLLWRFWRHKRASSGTSRP